MVKLVSFQGSEGPTCGAPGSSGSRGCAKRCWGGCFCYPGPTYACPEPPAWPALMSGDDTQRDSHDQALTGLKVTRPEVVELGLAQALSSSRARVNNHPLYNCVSGQKGQQRNLPFLQGLEKPPDKGTGICPAPHPRVSSVFLAVHSHMFKKTISTS